MTTHTELRVHGVSGTPPRDMLYTDPEDVAGQYPDPRSRKPKSYTRIVDRPERDRAGDVALDVRGFHWGGLTSGAAITAFWILLAPFALANTAGWMIARGGKWARLTVRLAGLALTGIFATQLGTSLILFPALWASNRQTWWSDAASVVAAVAAPIALTGLVVFFSMASHVSPASWKTRLSRLFSPADAALEQPTAAEQSQTEWPPIGEERDGEFRLGENRSPSVFIEFCDRDEGEDPAEVEWDDPADGASITGYRMWHETVLLPRLTRFHLAGGFTVMAAIVAGQAQVWWVVFVCLGVMASTAVGIAAITLAPTSFRWLSRWITWLGVAALVLAYVMSWTAGATPPNWYAAHVVTFWVGAVFVFIAIASLFVAGPKTAGALALGGQIGTILGIIAGYLAQSVLGIDPASDYSLQSNGSEWVAVALLFEIGVLILTSLWLSGKAGDAYHPSEPEAPFEPGQRALLTMGRRVEQRVGVVLTAAALYGFATIAAVAVQFAVAGEPPDPRNLDRPSEGGAIYWAAAVMAAAIVIWVASILARNLNWTVKRVLWTLVGAALAGGFVVWAVATDNLRIAFLGLEANFTDLTAVAVAVSVILPGSFMLRSIYKGVRGGQDSRRQVGILWDLTTFWPRWFQPIGPPSYGPFVVRSLRDRLIRGMPPESASPGAAFSVLGAHSQGSLIAGITVDRLVQEARSEAGRDPDRVPRAVVEGRIPQVLVTYGSQLGGLYPAMFPLAGIDVLCARLAAAGQSGDEVSRVRWRNLWRPTDPIGGHWVEPLGEGNVRVETDLQRGHSGYEISPEYWDARQPG